MKRLLPLILTLILLSNAAVAQAVGIGYELGARSDTTYGLRKNLMTYEGREAFWVEQQRLVDEDGVTHFVFSRFYGEKIRGDFFDYDMRWQIERSGDTALTDYAKHMTRELIAFCRKNPDVLVDIYVGSLRHSRMQQLAKDADAWLKRFFYEIEIPRMLMREGCNVRVVFDHASSFEPDSLEWLAVKHLSRMHAGRVVIESVPEVGSPQAELPAFALEDHYQTLLARDPERLDRDGVTRMTHGASQDEPIAFTRACWDRGDAAVVLDTALRRNELSIVQVRAGASAGRPQGVE